jgi:hypothetical protein
MKPKEYLFDGVKEMVALVVTVRNDRKENWVKPFNCVQPQAKAC